MVSSRSHLIVLGAVAALLFLTNTWGYDLWSPDEPRFGQIAREMLQSGNYLAPHINNKPYIEKPPLLFWMIAAASIPFGDVTEFSARLPSALCGIIAVLATYLLARKMYGDRVALWSGLILATTTVFWTEARSTRTDMILTACLTVGLMAFWFWRETRQGKWLLLFYAAIAAGGMAKGPPAYVFPALLVVSFCWGRKSERRETHWIAGMLVAVAVLLLWYVPARMAIAGEAHQSVSGATGSELYRQIIGRLFLGVSKANYPWYYLEKLPMTLFPWILFLPWSAPWIWKRRNEDDRMRFLGRYACVSFIFFSLAIGKRTIYLLPIYPAIAILLSRSILDLMDVLDVESEGKRCTRWRKGIAFAWAAVLIVAALTPFGLLFSEYRDVWSPQLLAISLCASAFGADVIRRAVWTDARSLPAAFVGYFAGLVMVVVIVLFPAINSHKSARSICEPLRTLSEAKIDYRLYSLAFSREQYIYYSKHFHTPVLTDVLASPEGLTFGDSSNAGTQIDLVKESAVKAVEKTPIASFSKLQPSELIELQTAFRDALERADKGSAALFEKVCTEKMDPFVEEFSHNSPAYFFVQEKDWRWLLALKPEMANFIVLKAQDVGSRDVLLMANSAGVELVGKTPSASR